MTHNDKASTGDRRVRRTRASLQRALIELVAEQELSEIGVADVVDRADVSRSPFYDHYRDVHELAEAACASMIDDLLASLTTVDPAPAKPSDPREDPSPALTAFFTHFAEHAALYRSLLGPTGSGRVARRTRSVRRGRPPRRGHRLAAARMPATAARDDHPDRATPDRPTQQHRDGDRVTDGTESACVTDLVFRPRRTCWGQVLGTGSGFLREAQGSSGRGRDGEKNEPCCRETC